MSLTARLPRFRLPGVRVSCKVPCLRLAMARVSCKVPLLRLPMAQMSFKPAQWALQEAAVTGNAHQGVRIAWRLLSALLHGLKGTRTMGSLKRGTLQGTRAMGSLRHGTLQGTRAMGSLRCGTLEVYEHEGSHVVGRTAGLWGISQVAGRNSGVTG